MKNKLALVNLYLSTEKTNGLNITKIQQFCYNNWKHKNCDFYVFTNDISFFEYQINAPNIKIIPFNIRDLVNKLKEKIQLDISEETLKKSPYHICKLKPIFTKLFEDYLTEYDIVGCFDHDLIFGDLNKCIQTEREFYSKSIVCQIFNKRHIEFYKSIPNWKNVIENYKEVGRCLEKIYLNKVRKFVKKPYVKNPNVRVVFFGFKNETNIFNYNPTSGEFVNLEGKRDPTIFSIDLLYKRKKRIRSKQYICSDYEKLFSSSKIVFDSKKRKILYDFI